MSFDGELKQSEWDALGKCEKPTEVPTELSLDEFNDLDRQRIERLRAMRKAAWEFKRSRDFHWREAQDDFVCEFLKNKYETETIAWYKDYVAKKLKKKIKRQLQSVTLVKSDPYCWRVDIVGVLKGTGTKVRVCTRRSINIRYVQSEHLKR